MHELRITHTDIPGLLILRLGIQYNDDGWFKENWHRAKMTALGLPDFQPVQHNVTHVVQRGITRGFHAEPWDRLVSVVRGRAMGAWVDLRPGEGFGRTVTADLDSDTAVFVPRGVANAHQVLEDDTTLTYLLDHHWSPQARERFSSVNLFDPALRISWPISRDRAIVAHRDTLNPMLADATPVPPRRTLVVGTDTPLGRALHGALPRSDAMASADLAQEALDTSAYDTLIHAHGPTASGRIDAQPSRESWDETASRAQVLAGLARRHGMRYVHVSSDCAFEREAPEHPEAHRLSLADPHGQALAAGETVAAGVPRHLIVRTGWVVSPDEGFVHDLVTGARHATELTVDGESSGRLTFASVLAAGITHLLDSGAPSGTYNVTGDGRVVTWADVARRVYQSMGSDPGLIRTGVPADSQATARGGVLSLERVKATGFRPGNAWLDLLDHLPRPGVARSDEGAGSNTGFVVEEVPVGDGLEMAPGGAGVRTSQGTEVRPFTVLFVCTGNISRSAYAALAATAAAPAGLRFVSAGTRALVGEPIDPPMADELGGRGAPDGHRAQQLTRGLAQDADLILAMAAEHRRYILDEWATLGRKAFVIGHAARVLADAPEDLTLEGIVEHLWRHRTAETGDEVADPYRRGPEAAATAARQIDANLEAIVGALARLAAKRR